MERRSIVNPDFVVFWATTGMSVALWMFA